jgi:hypothetical protein
LYACNRMKITLRTKVIVPTSAPVTFRTGWSWERKEVGSPFSPQLPTALSNGGGWGTFAVSSESPGMDVELSLELGRLASSVVPHNKVRYRSCLESPQWGFKLYWSRASWGRIKCQVSEGQKTLTGSRQRYQGEVPVVGEPKTVKQGPGDNACEFVYLAWTSPVKHALYPSA